MATNRAEIPEWDLLPPMMVPRDPRWARLSKVHMKLHPACAVCGTARDCVPHHVKPVHLFPDGELDPDNLLTLCPPDHLLIGHLKNWRAYNPDAPAWATAIAKAIRDRPTAIAAKDKEVPSFIDTKDAVERKYEQFVTQHDPQGAL